MSYLLQKIIIKKYDYIILILYMEQFKIINKIGEGAYSTVYTVKRIEDGKIYALKKVKIKKLTTKEKSNALNEVRILASINSPYVISYKESFIDETDQTLNIIMEYADDGDLYQKIKLYIKNKTFFKEHDIWRIFIQITKGLHDLHEYNILHRDLKSANVFLFKNGMAKLGDLNVSKITTRGLGYTQTGTPYYASPEVWKDKPYNLKSDIWSLGCVFYELIMLTTPFKAKSMKDLFIKVKKGEYPPIYNTFSPKFQIVIDNILRVKPEERPNTEDILNMPEIVDKIEELNIFKNDNDKKHDFNSDINKFLLTTNYKINNGNNYILNEENKNENITLSKIFENRIKNNQVKRGKEKNLNINNSIELKNNKKYFNLQKKYEIVNIYNNNINYFRKLFNSKKKIVIKTIKYPKKFKDLNSKLPGVNYDNDKFKLLKNNLVQKKPKSIFNIHKILPKIKNNNNDKVNNEEIKNEINNNNDKIISKKNSINENNDKYNIINTLQMKINEKIPFNRNEKIDIIVEENNENKKFIKSKSVNLMKNLKYIYYSYIPKILRNKNDIKYNLSQENIFGNLNYSMNTDILTGNIMKNNYYYKNIIKEKKSANIKPSKLIPILRIKPY